MILYQILEANNLKRVFRGRPTHRKKLSRLISCRNSIIEGSNTGKFFMSSSTSSKVFQDFKKYDIHMVIERRFRSNKIKKSVIKGMHLFEIFPITVLLSVICYVVPALDPSTLTLHALFNSTPINIKKQSNENNGTHPTLLMPLFYINNCR